MKEPYGTAKIAIDIAMFTLHQGTLKVLLHTREKNPFLGRKELPGGLLLEHETAEETLKRKLQELIGTNDIFTQQFHTFTTPDRDPRERVISIGFISLVHEQKLRELNVWYDYVGVCDLAFDHEEILKAARNHLKHAISVEIIKSFMPGAFPLNKLQKVYEVLEEKQYDNRNFRKKMLASGIIKETKERENNVSHRPAKLFRFV